MWKKIIIWGAVAIVALLLVIQLIPFGRQHTNPPITQEPPWDSPQTRELVSQACFDCHSNETKWPWYSNIAPASWLVQRDVNEGRSEMNFSEWDRSGRGEPEEAAGLVASGEMPPGSYLMMHPEARQALQDNKEALIQGLLATLSGEMGAGGEAGEASEN